MTGRPTALACSCGGDMDTCTCGQPPVRRGDTAARARRAAATGTAAAVLLLAAVLTGCGPDAQPTPVVTVTPDAGDGDAVGGMDGGAP